MMMLIVGPSELWAINPKPNSLHLSRKAQTNKEIENLSTDKGMRRVNFQNSLKYREYYQSRFCKCQMLRHRYYNSSQMFKFQWNEEREKRKNTKLTSKNFDFFKH